jgi:hypothetical protein
MFLPEAKYAQDSFDLFGSVANKSNEHFKLSSFESNVSNFSNIKDWEFSITYGSEFSTKYSNYLYLLSLSKKIGKHFFNLRYTPGYQKDFTFSTGTSVIIKDSIPVTLRSKFHYEERFGLGYSYSILKNLNLGFTLRYFLQEISQVEATSFFSDSLPSITTTTITKDYNFWRGDLGLSYSPSDNFTFTLSSINLFSQNVIEDENKNYLLKTKKNFLFGFNYKPTEFFSSGINYETGNSFSVGTNFRFNIFSGNISISIQAVHDKYQNPFFAGVVPAINYASKYFSVTLSGVKYFSKRSTSGSFVDFNRDGIYNLFNNRFSFDKAVLTVNFALNTTRDKFVKIIDVKILQDIFPTLTDKYLDSPVAIARIVNLTDQIVLVKPSCYIAAVNEEYVQSPQINVAPKDTVEAPIFTLVSESVPLISRAQISQAIIVLNTVEAEPDDEFRKPILINDLNSWDGKVINLRYFVKKDYVFSQGYAKDILKNYKSKLDTLPPLLTKYFTARILFDDYVKKLVYIADPRASVDRVQFPSETLKLKGGDCDDLSVAFASLLGSIGVQSAFVDYKSEDGVSHVNLMFNTEIPVNKAGLLTANDKKFYLRKNVSGKDEVWIPLETTSLTDFNMSWEIAAQKLNDEALNNFGLAKGIVQIVDIY